MQKNTYCYKVKKQSGFCTVVIVVLLLLHNETKRHPPPSSFSMLLSFIFLLFSFRIFHFLSYEFVLLNLLELNQTVQFFNCATVFRLDRTSTMSDSRFNRLNRPVRFLLPCLFVTKSDRLGRTFTHGSLRLTNCESCVSQFDKSSRGKVHTAG
jgi:hypothetical protein